MCEGEHQLVISSSLFRLFLNPQLFNFNYLAEKELVKVILALDESFGLVAHKS